VSGSTGYRTKRRFVLGNFEAALSEEPRRGADRKLSDKEEALPIQPVGSPARAEQPAYKNSPSRTWFTLVAILHSTGLVSAPPRGHHSWHRDRARSRESGSSRGETAGRTEATAGAGKTARSTRTTAGAGAAKTGTRR